jgi:hypothetical protein
MVEKIFQSYKEHQKFARDNSIVNSTHWDEFISKNKHPGIYSAPDDYFKKTGEWPKGGFPEFLGYEKFRLRNKVNYRSYKEHQKFARDNSIVTGPQWQEFCKKNKPIGIRSDVDRYFKDRKEWPKGGWGEFLGTGATAPVNRIFLSYKEHEKFARDHNFLSGAKYLKYVQKNKPKGIRKNIIEYFGKTGEWPKGGMREFLGLEKGKQSYKEHQKFARDNGIVNSKQWVDFISKNRHPGIFSGPDTHFKLTNEWPKGGWGEFFGDEYVEKLSYQGHLKFARDNGIVNSAHWEDFISKNRHPGIYEAPDNHFRKIGKWPKGGWSVFCGNDKRVQWALRNKEALSYKEHQKFARDNNLVTGIQYREFVKKNKPVGIVRYANEYFKKTNEWPKGSWGEFLGTGRKAHNQMVFLSYKEHQKFARDNNITSGIQWGRVFQKNHPPGIYSAPEKLFTRTGEWPKGSWGEFLGTGRIAPKDHKYYPFYEAKILYQKFAAEMKSQNIQVIRETWEIFYDKNISDKKLTKWPQSTYTIKKVKQRLRGIKPVSRLEPGIDYYYDFYDTFGIEDPKWSTNKIIGLLKSLVEDDYLLKTNPDILADIIEEKGLDKIRTKYAKLFKLIPANNKNEEFSKYIKKFIESQKDQDYYQIHNFETDEVIVNSDKEIVISKDSEIHEKTTIDEIIDEPEFHDPGDVLKQAQKTYDLRMKRKFSAEKEMSLSDDKDSTEFYIRHFVNILWHDAFHDEDNFIRKTRKSKTGGEFSDKIRNIFLEEYSLAKKIEIPTDYDFKIKDVFTMPSLMQRYFTLMTKIKTFYANFSGTGAGKTIAALLASRVNKSKMTLIVCPNGVVTQWEEVIMKVFPKSLCITKGDAFSAIRDNSQFQYLIINYEQFQQANSKNNILKLASQKIDFVILDEIHFAKTTSLKQESKRRENLDELLSLIRENNHKWKAIGLSATPVVNNLIEGRSLIELISGQDWEQEIKTKLTLRNARKLHKKFTIMSMREEPEYKKPKKFDSSVVAKIPSNFELRNLNRDKLALDQLCTEARIPEIIKKIKGKTVIYTEFVGGRIPGKPMVLDMLTDALDKAKIKWAKHTGEDHSGHKKFVENKKIQVLIATKPISTGVDDLQDVCHNLIFNNLPWTHALYTQVIGRLIRKGQEKQVTIHHILADVEYDGKLFAYDKRRMDAIINKKTILDCAVSGVNPEKNLVDKYAALKALKDWIKRLEEGKRLDLMRPYRIYDSEPQVVKRWVKKYGDFKNFNTKLIMSTSENNFKRIQKDPESWYAYHSALNENKKKWSFDPNEEWIEKISKMKKSFKIGDFGCGEAMIARTFGKNRTVHSFDLHSDDKELVQECNIKSTPLKNESIDIAVYNLSLMGTDWKDFIKEAQRVLEFQGRLFISDTENHLKGYLKDLKDTLEELDFIVYRFETKGKFVMIEAIKNS